MIINLLLFQIIIKIILPYPTTITSSYTPLATPQQFESGTLEIVTVLDPVGSFQLDRSRIYTYNKSYTGTLKAFVVLIEIKDSAERQYIDINIWVQTISPTDVEIKQSNFGIPLSSFVGVIVTARVIVYSETQFPYIQLVSGVDSSVYYAPKIWLVGSTFLSNDDIQIFSFITKLKFDVSQTTEYSVSLVTSRIAGTANANLSIFVPHPTLFDQKKQIGIVVVFVRNDINMHVSTQQMDSISFRVPSITIVSNIQFVIGILGFSIKSSTKVMDFMLSSDYSSIVSPNSNSDVTFYNFFMIGPAIPTNYNFQLTQVLSYSFYNSTFEMIYEDVPDIGDLDLSQISVNETQKISILKITVIGKSIIVLCQYHQDIEGLPLQVKLKWTKKDIQFLAVTKLTLSTNPPLKIYSDQSRKKIKIVAEFSNVIQYFYLFGFVLSLLSTKLIGIQLMQMIQLTFFCQISLNTVHIIFYGFSNMKYSNGYNIKFQSLPQLPMTQNYSALGISSNFLTNINIMLIPALICPILFGLLYFCSKISKSYKYKPRLRHYAISCLCEWPFTFLMFNAYNIYSSLIVFFQTMGDKNIGILVAAVTISLLPISINILYVRFRIHYDEFTKQINQSLTVLNNSLQRSKLICGLYPCVLSFQMLLIPMFLGSQLLINYNLYIVLFLLVLTTVFIVLVRPYDQKLNNIRLLVHRSLMTILIIIMVVSKQKITADLQIEEPILNVVWAVVCILIFDILINIPFILWKLVFWIKKNGIIDMKLYLQQKGKIKREQATLQSGNPIWYPILQYGIGRQNLLNKENERRRINLANIRRKDSEQNHQKINYRQMIDQKLKQERLN